MHLFIFSVTFCSYFNNCAKDSKCIYNTLIFGGISDHFPDIQKQYIVMIFFVWFCNGISIMAEDVDISLILIIIYQYKYLIFFEVSFLQLIISFTSSLLYEKKKMYFFLIADKLLVIVFRILVSNYIFVHLEHDIRSFTI